MKIPKHWTFQSDAVATGFDAHVREQLPWYDLATFMVAEIARHYVPDGGWVYDIGASTGNFGRAIADTLADRKAELTAIEAAPEMVKKYAGPGTVRCENAVTYEYAEFDLAVAFLVLMFVPVGQRLPLLKRLADKVKPGGAIIVFDKFEPPAGYVGTVLRRVTLAGKVRNKAAAQDVLAKELSLAGVQRPLPATVLRSVGNLNVAEVFRFGEFAGYVLERQE